MHLMIRASGDSSGVVSHLLAKNPQNVYDRTDKGVRVRMVYTRDGENDTEVLIHAEPDPVDLVKSTPDGYDITQYINDREFVTSSLFCSYIRSALGTALNGKPKEPYLQWVDHPFDLELTFGPVASDLPDKVVEEVFNHLGYEVSVERGELSYAFELKKRSTVRRISLRGKVTVQNALRQLFVLIPVLDDYKHYFIGEDEIDKLRRYGSGWLDEHPLKDMIVRRTLRFADLIRQYERMVGRSSAGLDVSENQAVSGQGEAFPDSSKESLMEQTNDKPQERPIRLNELRYRAIVDIVAELPSCKRIVDMGAGEGKLSARLAYVAGVESILAVEPSGQSRLRAMERFAKLEEREDAEALPESVIGSLFYFDEHLQDQDVMILCEVIEHVEEYRLNGIMEMLFHDYRPKVLIVTTPNREYNDVYEMERESMRHHDHRFEWDRTELAERCKVWTHNSGYTYDVRGIGEEAAGFGQPTQLVIFTQGKEWNA